MKNKIDKDRIKELVNEAIENFLNENEVQQPTGQVNVKRGPEKTVVAKTQTAEPSVTTATSEPGSISRKPEETVVRFDKNTEEPFNVTFSERGFSINGTRLSFETIKNALSKEYTITLDNGNGFVLTPVRMQKILKYENTY